MPRPPVAIELRHLRYFLAVFEELHFGRAADRLHIAQPPLSQAIRRLENELGVQLFHRTSRFVMATEAGKVFADEARKVLAAFDLAVAEVRRAAGGPALVRIGCSPFQPIENVNAILTAIRERDPSLGTQVTHLLSQDQRSRLLRGDLDVGIFPAPGKVDGLETEPLLPGEPIAAFLPPDHRLASKDVIRPADVAHEVLIVYPRAVNPILHDRFYSLIEDAGYQFRDKRESNGLTERDLLLAVLEGPGILLASYWLKDITAAGRLVVRRPLAPEVSMPDTVLAWRENPSPQLGRTLATLRGVARHLRQSDGRLVPEDPDAPDTGLRESV